MAKVLRLPLGSLLGRSLGLSLALILAVGLNLTCSATVHAQGTLADVIEKCEKSVVRIAVTLKDGGQSEGSGFVVAPNIIATNVHVLMGGREAVATFPNEKKFRIVGTYRIDPARDIAIARIEGAGVEDLTSLPLSKTTVRKGETVVALGSPLGLAFTATSGVISAVRSGTEITRELGSESIGGGEHQGSWVQLDAALSPGNSGGPVVNMQGEVVAMSTLASQGAQNLNFGISSQDIATVLNTVSEGAPVSSLESGIGNMKSKRSQRSSPDNIVSATPVPAEAIAAYVTTGKSEFRTLKRDLSKEIERLRSTLKEMRSGQTSIPANVNTESDVIRVPGKRDSYNWFFRSEAIKRNVVSALDSQLKDLTKISSTTGDANDKNALLTLLMKYGPAIDMRVTGSVGFLSSATVLHAFNGHEALVLINEVPCIMVMESTAGLSRGEEIIPTPVFVVGTATARLPDGKTSAVTVVQSVTSTELKKAIFGEVKTDSTQPAPTTTASTPSNASNTGARMWYDKSGSFSVEAVLLEVTETEVVLRRTDGKKIRVPRKSLSEADQRYLRQ